MRLSHTVFSHSVLFDSTFMIVGGNGNRNLACVLPQGGAAV